MPASRKQSRKSKFALQSFKLMLDPETIVFGILGIFVMAVYSIVRLILEVFTGGPPQGL